MRMLAVDSLGDHLLQLQMTGYGSSCSNLLEFCEGSFKPVLEVPPIIRLYQRFSTAVGAGEAWFSPNIRHSIGWPCAVSRGGAAAGMSTIRVNICQLAS